MNYAEFLKRQHRDINDIPPMVWKDQKKVIRGRGYLGVQKSVSNQLYDMKYLEDKLTAAELSGLVEMIHDHVKAAWQEGLNQGEELKPVKKDFRCSRCGIRWSGINILDNPIHTCTFCGGKIV